jgi:hypothetical protein
MSRPDPLLSLSTVAEPAKEAKKKKKPAKENQSMGKGSNSAKKAGQQKRSKPQKGPMSIQVSDDDAPIEAAPSGVRKV